jgi:hypothetical protein
MATILTPITDLDDLGTDTWSAAEAASGYFSSDEFWLDAVNKVFYFLGEKDATSGALAAAGSGVTGQALYSFFKERWKEDPNLPQYPFPMLSITNEQFEFQNGWKPADGELVGNASDITVTGGNTINSTTLDLSVFSDADFIILSGSSASDGAYRVSSATANAVTIAGTITNDAGPITGDIYRNAIYHTDGTIVTTRDMIRTAGWSELEVGGGVSRRYSGVVTLGALAAADQPYYVQDSSFNATPSNTVYSGAVNQGVQWYGNVDYGDDRADDYIGNVGTVTINPATTVFDNATSTIDFGTAHAFNVGDLIKIVGSAASANNSYWKVTATTTNVVTIAGTLTDSTDGSSAVTATLVGYVRDDYFKIFVRTREKTYADADLVDIGVSELTYIVYRFPLTNADDLNIATTDDAAFSGAAISTIDGDGTTITVVTSVNHGLYAGAPVFVINTGVANFGGATGKLYTIAALDQTTPLTKFTITSGDTGSGTAGTTQLGYTNDITVKYMVNPDTGDGDVVLTGNYANTTTYAAGDVAFDVDNTVGAAGGPQWYYVDGTPSNAGATTSIDADNTAAAGTWALWDPTILYGDADSAIGAFGGQRNIEEDATAGTGATDGTWSAYTVEIDANQPGATDAPGATKEVIYEYAQYLLRQTTNINDLNIGSGNGSVRRGDIAEPLVFFVGSTLNTSRDASIPSAVVIDDIAAIDVNNIQYNEALSVTYDGGARSTAHRAPIVVTVTINFNPNLASDFDAVFYQYYKTGTGAQAGNDFGTVGALEVQRTVNGVASDVGSDISQNVPDNGVYQYNYAYDADTTNGRTGGTDVTVITVAIGLETGQYVSSEDTITESGATISLVAPLERNYVDVGG